MINVPETILPKSALYMRIIFLGLPFSMIYNFGCSILRAGGDTQRPLYFLIAAGIVNVGLNLLFVALFKWDVAGVAVATIISQGLSAILVLRAMMTARGASRLLLKNLRFDWKSLKKLLAFGVPAGIQGVFFSISNIIIQGAINTFVPQAMAGMTATVCLSGSFTRRSTPPSRPPSFSSDRTSAPENAKGSSEVSGSDSPVRLSSASFWGAL
jgi:Na+-driven multidrug efflux pump